MQAELDAHLADEAAVNRKNGTTSKTMKDPSPPFGVNTPRDRAGTFEPQIVKKHQTYRVLPSYYDPHHPNDLIRQGDNRFVLASPGNQHFYPATEPVFPFVDQPDNSPCAVNHQASHIRIATLADASQLILAARTMLPRYHAYCR